MTAHFSPGDRVLFRRLPREAWTVTSLVPDRMVWCRSETVDAKVPEEKLMPAPLGWRDPPEWPMGRINRSLDYADKAAAEATDEDDAEYQQDLWQYHIGFANWAITILVKADPDNALAVYNSRLQMAAECRERIGELTERRAA